MVHIPAVDTLPDPAMASAEGGYPLQSWSEVREALDALMDPVVFHVPITDAFGRIADFECIFANRAAGVFIGRSPDDLRGARMLEVFPEHSRAGLLSAYADVMTTGEPYVVERFAYKDGAVDAVVDIGAYRIDHTLAVTWRDVSERERTSEQVRLQARLLDEVDAAVIFTDLGYRIEYWSKGAERLYGWTAEEAIGRTTFELLLPEMTEEDLARSKTQTLKGPRTTERELATKDGRRVFALARVTPIAGLGETPLRGIVGVSVDVSQQHENEDHLREARDFLSAVTGSMGEGMFALDAEGRLSYMNPAAARMLGWSEEELRGELMHDITHHHRADGSAFPVDECPLLRARSTGETVEVDRDTFFCRDGSLLPVAYSSSPLQADGIRGCVVVFRDISDQLQEELRLRDELERLSWVGRIQDALNDDRFVLYAQPIMRLRDRAVTQHELLIRMRLGDEVVLPGKFLPAAEQYGLIGQIDRWVVGQAAVLAAAGHHVEFNLSARSISDPQILSLVRQAVLDTGADPANLVCEITETALVENDEVAERFVRGMTDLGCAVALDDFGVGYGGLAYLKRLPVAQLKIDAQFVRDAVTDMSSRHVISAVVSLAKAFGLETVAEGAETEETVELVAELGVDFVQGYAVSRPQPLHAAFAQTSVNRRGGSDE